MAVVLWYCVVVVFFVFLLVEEEEGEEEVARVSVFIIVWLLAKETSKGCVCVA